MTLRALTPLLLLPFVTAPVSAAPPPGQPPLIVVEDRGGASALDYYRALNLQPQGTGMPTRPQAIPSTPSGRRYSDADMLPVRSSALRPGDVAARTIAAPGLTPFFLIGDDARSRDWLRQRADTLRRLDAKGLVVNVETSAGLKALRAVVPGLTLAPTPGDDLAQRLGLRHYPILVTATGIEQ